MQALKSDHEDLGELLERVKTELAIPNLHRAFETLDLFWASLAVHIRAEHICLFPAVLNAPRARFGESNGGPDFELVKATVAGLRADHNVFMTELSELMKKLRDLVTQEEDYWFGDVIAEVMSRINRLEELLSRHNEVEEDLIYRWPSLLLDQESLNQLEVGVVTQIENLPPRLATT